LIATASIFAVNIHYCACLLRSRIAYTEYERQQIEEELYKRRKSVDEEEEIGGQK
jgi:hypothetical protein